jgi:hypothetical protein
MVSLLTVVHTKFYRFQLNLSYLLVKEAYVSTFLVASRTAHH